MGTTGRGAGRRAVRPRGRGTDVDAASSKRHVAPPSHGRDRPGHGGAARGGTLDDPLLEHVGLRPDVASSPRAAGRAGPGAGSSAADVGRRPPAPGASRPARPSTPIRPRALRRGHRPLPGAPTAARPLPAAGRAPAVPVPPDLRHPAGSARDPRVPFQVGGLARDTPLPVRVDEIGAAPPASLIDGDRRPVRSEDDVALDLGPALDRVVRWRHDVAGSSWSSHAIRAAAHRAVDDLALRIVTAFGGAGRKRPRRLRAGRTGRAPRRGSEPATAERRRSGGVGSPSAGPRSSPAIATRGCYCLLTCATKSCVRRPGRC